MQHDRKRAFHALWSWVGIERNEFPRSVSEDDISNLDDKFVVLNHQQKADVYLGYRQALDASNKLEVWEFGSLLDGFPLGDDGFKDFQRWLILQGKKVFETVIRTPDDFAEFLHDDGEIPDIDVASMGVLDEFEDRFSLAAAVPMSGPTWGSSDSSAEQISRHLPKLWKRLGHSFDWGSVENIENRSISIRECTIAGMGVVRVGDKLKLKAKGTVVEIVGIIYPEIGILKINDRGNIVACKVSSDCYEKLS